ncbi:unnamed protein product, partial [Didymodactylos carnosus]
NPLAYLSFVPEHGLKWRNNFQKEKIYPYEYENEIYRVMCSVHHKSDVGKPLDVYILKRTCIFDDCLYDLIDITSCDNTRNNWIKLNVNIYEIDKFLTQFTRVD